MTDSELKILEDLARTLLAAVQTLADVIDGQKPKAPIPKTARVRIK